MRAVSPGATPEQHIRHLHPNWFHQVLHATLRRDNGHWPSWQIRSSVSGWCEKFYLPGYVPGAATASTTPVKSSIFTMAGTNRRFLQAMAYVCVPGQGEEAGAAAEFSLLKTQKVCEGACEARADCGGFDFSGKAGVASPCRVYSADSPPRKGNPGGDNRRWCEKKDAATEETWNLQPHSDGTYYSIHSQRGNKKHYLRACPDKQAWDSKPPLFDEYLHHGWSLWNSRGQATYPNIHPNADTRVRTAATKQSRMCSVDQGGKPIVVVLIDRIQDVVPVRTRSTVVSAVV